MRKDIGRHIRLRRSDIGLSQTVLAQKIGISPRTMRRIENGTSSLPFESAPALIVELGIKDVNVLYQKPVVEWG
jgi:ribosome-binding protein aMBF1 (putative translation factor)